MRNLSPSSRTKLLVAILGLCILFPATSLSQRYNVGDIVENITLVNRANDENVSLYDLEGKVIFLEWFAYWCPYCQAAAEDVYEGIVQHYSSSGNANGVPVMHVGLNLQGGAEAQTQNFVDRFRMELVLNDFDASFANRFQNGGQPIFAIINGVKDSESHQQWELVYSRLGYGDFTQPIATFRQAIDSVAAAAAVEAPAVTTHPQSQTLATQSELTLTVHANGQDLSYQWLKDNAPLEGQNGSTLKIAPLTLKDAGPYSVIISNAGGSVTSQTAQISVKLSLADYLASAGLEGDLASIYADPDLDGSPNAFEYLAQTDPNDFDSAPHYQLHFTESQTSLLLTAAFTPHEDSIGYVLKVETSHDPSFTTDDSLLHTFPESGFIQTPISLDAPPSPIFARLVVQAL